MKCFQARLVAKDPHARPLFNPEAATKHLAQTERPFLKHKVNLSRNIIRQGSSEPEIVKQIRSPLVKPSPPLLDYRSGEGFWAIHRLNFGVDHPGFQSFEREETNHHSLFHISPQQICRGLRFDGCRTRQIAKGRRAVSKERRGLGIYYIYLLFI
jgi:hypothetical protein